MIHEMKQRILKEYATLIQPKTHDIRRLAKSYKKHMKDWPIEDVLALGAEFLHIRTFKSITIGYQIIQDHKDKFTTHTFDSLEDIVYEHLQDWWDTDDFMTHAMGYYLLMFPEYLPKVKEWVTHERFAVRRAAAVALIVPARQEALDFSLIREVCDLLYNDDHYLVLKGYGWLLKEASKRYHDEVYDYLKSHASTMPRTAFRYGLEKLPEEEKQYLMSL